MAPCRSRRDLFIIGISPLWRKLSRNPTNTPQITVSELAQSLKRTLEERFGYVRVRGEISGYRGPHASGHVYFSLKDEGARLDAVIWRTTYLHMKVRPEDGLEVIASGKITTFAGKSSYQIIVESLEPAGVGALMALLESRRRQLAAEGLFNADRKRPLPFLPRVLGVVTSPNGSVIRDILHRLADRFPTHVILWPVRVQGESSAEEISAAIRGFNALDDSAPVARPDVLIVARGGGSLEDLWSFNDEEVVRAAAESKNSSHLRGRPRNRLDFDRLCVRCSCADSDGGRGNAAFPFVPNLCCESLAIGGPQCGRFRAPGQAESGEFARRLAPHPFNQNVLFPVVSAPRFQIRCCAIEFAGRNECQSDRVGEAFGRIGQTVALCPSGQSD